MEGQWQSSVRAMAAARMSKACNKVVADVEAAGVCGLMEHSDFSTLLRELFALPANKSSALLELLRACLDQVCVWGVVGVTRCGQV